MEITLGGVIFEFDFIMAFLLGGIVLTLICYERFGQPVENEESFVSTLLPELLATKQDYLKAFLVYLSIMLSIYVLASLIGPNAYKAFHLSNNVDIESGTTGYRSTIDAGVNENEEGLAEVFTSYQKTHAPAWVPLLVMMILSGLSTNYKAFNKIELVVRKLTHRIIGIPDSIEKLANELQIARLNIPSLNSKDQMFIAKKFEFATGRPLAEITRFYEEIERSDPLRRWIRLQFLYDRLENKRQIIGQVIDLEVLDHYRNMWNEIKLDIMNLSHKRDLELIDKDRELPESSQELNRAQFIESKIDATLHNVHAIVAASIARRCYSPKSIKEAIGVFGLSLKEVEKKDFANAVIASIFVMTLIVFLIVFFTYKSDSWLSEEIYKSLPTGPYDAFVWATGALFLHGAAALAAWKYQDNRRRKKTWETMDIRKLQIPSKQYLILSLKVYVYATASLFVWWLAQEFLKQGPFEGISSKQIWIPLFGLVGVITGIYVAYTIDLCSRPDPSNARLAIQPAFQAIFTALLSYIIMSMIASGPSREVLNLYVGGVMAIEGLTIGIIVLMLARQIHLQRSVE
jgi:hypothetical protein